MKQLPLKSWVEHVNISLFVCSWYVVNSEKQTVSKSYVSFEPIPISLEIMGISVSAWVTTDLTLKECNTHGKENIRSC